MRSTSRSKTLRRGVGCEWQDNQALKEFGKPMDAHEVTPVLESIGGAQSGRGEVLAETNSERGSLDRILTAIEKREIVGALKRAKGQRTLAAQMLGISRSRLYRRMEALSIDPGPAQRWGTVTPEDG